MKTVILLISMLVLVSRSSLRRERRESSGPLPQRRRSLQPTMKHILALITGILLSSSGAILHASEPSPRTKPNIIFILADDAGIGDFSAYGCKYGVTPNIDRLATEGMKFTRAYSGSAVCAPSRGVLMTGQHTGHALRRANQSKHGLLALPTDQMTVARVLHDAGYATVDSANGAWAILTRRV